MQRANEILIDKNKVYYIPVSLVRCTTFKYAYMNQTKGNKTCKGGGEN